MKTIRIGAGSGFGGDRIEPAVELAEKGALDYLVFECLAERTIALAQQARLQDPNAGYDRLLDERMRAVLPVCRRSHVRIVSNMGAANPAAAAQAIASIGRDLGYAGLKIAYVLGDDVLGQVRETSPALTDGPGAFADIADRAISANAYLGVAPIVEALAGGADVVITGRVGDPALFMAPLAHEFGWREDDWERLGRGALIGHLLECGSQLTGGYFADPGVKDVADLARLGFPLAEVDADGGALFSKVEGSGGELSLRTCKEQLLYEVHDPARYIQPDVVADFTSARFEQVGPNRVRLSGGGGSPRTDSLKVTIGHHDGFIGEGQISYAGAGAEARARLALAIVEERLRMLGVAVSELRLDVIGVDSVYRGPRPDAEVLDVRARVAGRTASLQDAQRIGREVEAVWINGPAGGGGATWSARQVVAAASALLPRSLIAPTVHWLEA
ncbi:ABC transporter substrate-binding protein [Alsobacter metallidurans]|uniref:ABC transporter substrate-binding protein n=1 Tax=Alsobacter metallidurans TaxID=340221 RepID=A0A917I8Z3_9HYPH|nr:acyclic terpene utilization AtuA family protein [Alsobacter metallidurans]GGH24446.1 ABC transporter substrate-binding protein [Alsobacter metallidurans]